MKRILSLILAGFVLQASVVFGAVIQDWTSVQSGNAGPYNDNATKVDFSFDAGPKAGEKALKITANISASGYGGIYTNAHGLDLSKFGALKFMVKSTVPGELQIAITDAFNVQYDAKLTIPSKDWTEVTVPLASFVKDPYYTPPNAIVGHPLDWSKVGNLNFSPQVKGESIVMVGPVSAEGTASGSPAASSAVGTANTASSAASSSSSGASTAILDCTGLANDGKNAGTFQDSLGSSFTFAIKDNPSKKGQQYLTVSYEEKQGGYCGMWARAGGSDWKGANLTGAKTVSLMVYSKDSVVLGLALKDANNNQYSAEAPATKG